MIPSCQRGDFAALCNVKPSRLSHWIAEGRISGSAIVGEGRSARIRVEEAQKQLRRTLDPNQMTANGNGTNLGPAPAAGSSKGDVRLEGGGLDLTDERARLAKEQADDKAMRNAERRGVLINAAEAEERWSQVIIDIRTQMLRVPADLRTQLPELTPLQLDKIDRVIRDALVRAADGHS